jgi:VIT1/CCC1 family predicted Fe2+/Mn2+ transporter
VASAERTIHNERVKLGATWLNGLSIAVFAVGGFAPVISGFSGERSVTLLVGAVSVVCILLSGALHYWARASLRRLIE